jgi:thiol-disulfide isomerase/thioredoxin
MFKRSFLLVSLIFLLVFASAFASQMWSTRDLPSAYDKGLTIEKAFKTSKVPLLIEFYSDSCGTCKRLTPVIHSLEEGPYQGKLTLVMLDVNEPGNQDIARLFGVDSLPGLYVFDHLHMKKHAIKAEDFATQARLQQAIDSALLLSRTGARSS